MANETTDIPTWVKVVLSVIGSAVLIWGVATAASRKSTSHDYLVSSHETRITEVEQEVDDLDTRMDSTEKMQISLQKDQQAILAGQTEMKSQLSKQAERQLEQIKVNADLNAYLRTIEKIE